MGIYIIEPTACKADLSTKAVQVTCTYIYIYDHNTDTVLHTIKS